MNTASMPVLWANCIERLKDRVNNRSFWEAIEQTHPVTIEDDTLIFGMEPHNFNRAGHIQQPAIMNTVRDVVAEVFNRELQVRLIEGISLADWDALKERESRLLTMRQQSAMPARTIVSAADTDSWETLYDQLARLHAQTAFRNLPQGKARFANEALYLISEAMDILYTDNANDTSERSLARALERVSSSSEIPAAVLAFELERLRAYLHADTE